MIRRSNTKPLHTNSPFHAFWPFLSALFALLLFGATFDAARAASYVLEGYNKGDSNNWFAGNLQDWQELDYIPCRIRITGGPIASQTFTITFPHIMGTTPGFENLYNFVGSSNVVFLSDPVLASPAAADWSYTFTVAVTNSTTATVNFSARLAAGAHRNVGSSLHLSGNPSSMGTLQVHKPAPRPGNPDLAIKKTGPGFAPQGGIFTYALAYTNRATNPTNIATDVQVSDILPPEITVQTNSLGANAHFAGNTIFWDLTNVAAQANGQIAFQVRVNTNVPVGSVIMNFSQILSAENDVNYADNTSTWNTTVTGPCVGPTLACAGNKTVPCGSPWNFDNPTPGNYTDSNGIVVLNTVTNPACGNTFTATRTWQAADACGNLSQCSQTVAVVDNTAPVITCSSGKTVTTGTAWTFDEPTATDACGTSTIIVVGTVTNGLGGCGDTFIATRTWRASDGCGNSSQCSQTVTVLDRTSPQITCPGNFTVNAAVGSCTSNVTFIVTATDNCSVTNLVSNPPSGSAFPVGVTLVTSTATDASGNTNSCNFTVTVTDAQNPVITCPSNLVLAADAGRCSRSNVIFTVSATDNCGVTNLVSSPPSGSTFPIGTTTVTNTATDASGNQANCSFTVTVTDTQNPGITCPSNLVLAADAGGCSRSNVIFTVSATDNCGVTNLVSNPPSGSTFPVGATTVITTATDASGNEASCSFTVTVSDTQGSGINCSSNLVLTADLGQCSRSNVTFFVSATDNCGVTNLVSSVVSGSTFPVGTTIVTNTATDASGNTSSCTFTVTVTDNQNPVITCPGNLVLSADAGRCGRSNVTFTVSAADNCSVTNLVSSPPSGSTFPVGTTTVTNTATDASGNTSSCTFTVTVTDNQNLVLTCPGNLVLSADAGRCGRSNVTFTVSATDNCSVTNLVSNPPSGSTFPVGTTTVINTATDASGNEASCNFTVTVSDTQGSGINCSSNLVLTADLGQCSRSNVTFFVSATDNCGVTNLVSSVVSGSTFPVGTTTVTNTATDASGNTSSCTFTVTVTDNQNPVITCPGNLVLSADAGRCGRSNVTFTVSATDNCSVTNLVSSPPSGSTFPVGTTTVINTATDASGNQSTCNFTVTVTDTQNSVLICSSNLVLAADAGQCSRSNVTFFVSATDNCGVTNLVSGVVSGSTFPVGTTTVTNTATDASGNTSSCTFTVTVTDNQNPAITCPSNLVLSADAGRCSRSNVTFTVSATDNCSVTNLVSSPPSGSTFPVGTTTVINTATDASGNQSTCNFTVTVTDTQNSVLICSSNLVLAADAGQCSRSNVTFFVSATDNCGVTNLVSSVVSGNTFSVGTTTVTNTATDASGNTSSCTFTVTVTDNQDPVITCPGNLVLAADAGRCSRSNVTFTVSATDNCSVTNLVSSPPSGSTFRVGTTTVINTATDASGNQASCSFTVTVTDTQNSVLICSSNLVLAADAGQCSRSNVTFFVSATDNCGVTNLVSSVVSGSTFPVGTTTVTNTATDASGNASSCTFTVTVTDNQNPVITCPGNLVLSADAGRCSRSNVAFTVSATDNCSVTNLVSSPPSGSTFPVGTTTVINTATDASGNEASCSFTVTVSDTQGSGINCSSNLVLTADPGQCSRSNVTFFVSATDNCGVTNLVSSVVSGSTFPVGTTTITNTATDASGNTSSCTFTVTVTDNQNPIITCPSNLVLAADVGRCSRSNVAFTVSATDNCGVTNLVSSVVSGSTFPVGTTTVTNTATDASGNTSSCTFTVTVTDNQNPVITCPSNLVLAADTGRCSRSNVTFTVSATDNCSVTNLVSIPPSGSTFPVGTTTVINTATDASGNQSTCNFTVTVTDTQNSVLLCSSNLVLVADAGRCSRSNVTFFVSATDNCGVTNLVSSVASGSTFPVGTTTVTNTATDASGNTSSCTFTVTVTDNQNPVLTCPGNLVLSADAGRCSRSNVTFTVSATDNCSVTNLVSNPPSGSTFPVGTTTVINTATDASGNEASCSFTVTVSDTQGSGINCSSNLVLTADLGQCSRSNVTFFVSATDNCGVTNLVSSPPSGSTFPVGTTTVINTATDASGNQSTCNFTVTVTDTQNSVLICSSNLVLAADAGQCSRSNVTFFVRATDNCGVTNLVSSVVSGSRFPVGTTTVTNTATDASGNTSSCTFTVTVTDNQNPVITCPGNLVLSADAGRCSRSNVTFTVSATDNCSVTNLVSSPPSGSTFPVGTTTVINTATDASGNQSTCNFTVTVTDTQNSVLICSSNLVLAADAGQCSRSNVTFFVRATDNCGVTNLVSSVVSGNTFPVGTTTVTNTATDASGNTSSCTFTVTVTDNQDPVITCPGNLVLAADAGRCSRSNVTFAVSATDNCSVTNLVSSPPSGSTFPVGTTTVINTATDASGNQASCSFTVTVTDTQNSVLICSSNLVLAADAGQCSRSNVTFFVSATDNCGVTNLVSSVVSGSTFPVGTTTVANTATDASGNTSSCTFTVTVTDNQTPVITCPGNLVLSADAGRCSRSNVIFTVSATDNCNVTNLVSGPPSGSTFPIGTTTVTSTATDASGNRASCSFTVTVSDTQGSVINCSSNLVLAAEPGQCSRSNVMFFVSATDNCGVTNLVSSRLSGSTFLVGTTTVTNTATDASGNISRCTFTVTVTDNQKPVITCSSNLVLTTDAGRCNRSNVIFTVTATDNCDVANLVSSPPSGSTFPLGVTTVASTATDASGNQSTCAFTVTVLDQQPPAITCPPDLTTNTAPAAIAVTNIALGTPIISDNCAVAGFSNNAPSVLPVGTNIVLWTVTDLSGNRSSCQQRVVVVRNCSGILNATPLANLTTCPKKPVLFETTASSPEPIHCQWKFNGQPMAGQTNRSLVLPSVDASHAGVYTLEVRTECALVTLSAALAVLAAPEASPTAYTNASPIVINESGEATPYGSAITLQCVPGPVRNLTVTVFGFFHPYPADVSMVLVSPDGRQVKLMSRAGGAESVVGGADLTFSDAAPNPLPETDEIVSGTYLPTDYWAELSLPPPAAGPYFTNLSAFIGTDPNGLWKLFVFDAVAYDGGGISSWRLNLEWQEKIVYLQNPSVLPNGGFRAEVVGQTGVPTIIQRSSNQVTWLPVATNVYSTSPGIFIDPAPLAPCRFYRALQP